MAQESRRATPTSSRGVGRGFDDADAFFPVDALDLPGSGGEGEGSALAPSLPAALRVTTFVIRSSVRASVTAICAPGAATPGGRSPPTLDGEHTVPPRRA